MKIAWCGWTLLATALLASCVGTDDETTGTVESAVTSYQGTRYQGTRYQGTRYQGTRYQGTRYQGTRYQGASYGGSTVSNAIVRGSVLEAWTLSGLTWAQRTPDRICYWNYTKSKQLGCNTINLATTPSPLTGIKFPSTFLDDNGNVVNGYVQIGASSTAVGALTRDNTIAMHDLTDKGNKCTVIPQGPDCDNPDGCRINCDIWDYDIRLDQNDPTTGAPATLCPPGETTIALSGTWDSKGTFTADSTKLTFACTGGTIAKCTRWGYRPFGSAVRSDGVMTSLADYHQACIRAATADYCANGTSFTKDGTLVDFYDYDPQRGEVGFVPRTRDNVVPDWQGTAFVWESSFDKWGATQLDHTRYEELESGSLGGLAASCPGLFYPSTDDVLKKYNRCRILNQFGTGVTACTSTSYTYHDYFLPNIPMVHVDSTPACAHSETQVGKWLNEGCSVCTNSVTYSEYNAVTQTYTYAHCTDPKGGGWDSSCVAKAASICPVSSRMGPHNECTTGAPLGKYSSGCALKVCLDPNLTGCCASGGSWNAQCTAAANQKCTGGLESALVGFCGLSTTTNPL